MEIVQTDEKPEICNGLYKLQIFWYSNFMKKRSFGRKSSFSGKAAFTKVARANGTKFRRGRQQPKSDKPSFGRARIPVSETFKKKTTAQKLIESLQNKKDRDARELFLVEGEKSFLEVVQSSYELYSVFATHMFLATYPEIAEFAKGKINIVDAEELSGMGTLANNMSVIGVFKQKRLSQLVIGNEIALAVSDVNDPGNLGTLVRIADWYGIRKIIASKSTVDLYNPKTISATKGSFTRVDVYYTDLEDFFLTNKDLPVVAADLEGNSAHTAIYPSRGVLLLGSEAHGIDHDLKDLVTTFVTIPRYGDAESLNVAVAGGIILDNWKKSL
jgi:TrmH family RNA methyltransferase